MTEIRPDLSASRNVLEQIRQRVQDGNMSKEELAELRATAASDSAGLDSNEEKLINSFDENFNSKENIAKNIESFKKVAAHDTTANEVDFSKVEVVSENRGLWSSVTSGFGLFGRGSTTSGVRVSEGNIPTTNNPTHLTTMSERRTTEIQNVKDMLGPLEKELQGNSDELHSRLAADLGIDPAAPDARQRTEAHRSDLLNRISAFKADPSNENFDAIYSDIRGMLNSYSKQAPSQTSAMTGPYVTSLRASLYNLSDANSLSEDESKSVTDRGAATPANADEINNRVLDQTKEARQQITDTVQNAEAFTQSLDNLRSKSPEEFKAVMGNFTEQDLDLLKKQIADLKAGLASNSPISQAQMSQLNQIWSSMTQVSNQPAYQAALKTSVDTNPEMLQMEREDIDQTLNAARTELASATTDEAKNAAQQKITQAEARLNSLNNVGPALSSEAQNVVNAYNKVFKAGNAGTVQTAFSKVQSLVQDQSTTLSQLEEAESTLSQLMANPSISVPERFQLDEQRQVVRLAKQALQSGQPITLTENQRPVFDAVMSSLRETSTPVQNATTTSGSLAGSINQQPANPVLSPGLGYTSSSIFNDFGLNSYLGNSSFGLNSYMGASTFQLTPYTPNLSNSAIGLSPTTQTAMLAGFQLDPSLQNNFALSTPVTTNLLADTTLPIPFRSPSQFPTLSLNMGTASESASALPNASTPVVETGHSTTQSSTQPRANSLAESLMRTATTRASNAPASSTTISPENQQRIATLEEIGRNPASTETLSPGEAQASQEYLANTISQLRAGQTVENVDQLISSYQSLKQTAGANAAAWTMSQAMAQLQSGTNIETVKNRLTELGNDQNLRSTFEQNRTSVANQKLSQLNQTDANTKTKINQAGQNSESPLAILASQSGYTPGSTKSMSQHFAQMSNADFAALDIRGQITAIQNKIAQTAQGSAAASDGSNIQQLRVQQAQLEATLVHRQAYQERMQSLDQGITRLDNQLKNLTPPTAANSAARTALTAQITEMRAVRESVMNEQDLTGPQLEAIARAEVLRITGATISHLNKLNNSDNSPEFRAIYARYTELLRGGQFSVQDMANVYQMIETAAQSGSRTFRLPTPPLDLKVTTVDDITNPSTASDGTINVREEQVRLGHGSNPGIIQRAAAGAIVTQENFQIQRRTTTGMINVDVSMIASGNGFTIAGPHGDRSFELGANGQSFTVTGPQGTSTFDVTALTTPGPLRDAALRRLSDPNSLPSQIVKRLSESGALSPQLQAVFTSLQNGGNSSETGALSAASAPPATSILADSTWLTNKGGTSITDPEGTTPPRSMSELGPDADPPPTLTEAALYAVEQPQTLSESERQESLGYLEDANRTIDQTLNDIAKTTLAVTETMKSFNKSKEPLFDSLFNQMMVGLAQQGGITPAELNEMAKKDPQLDADTRNAIESANKAEAELELAPMPAVSGDQIFGEWLTETMGIIRNWDEDTRKIVMAQIAKQMMDQVINTFYKDKLDESSSYHENQIANLRSHRTETVQQERSGRDVQSAENSQAVAAQSALASSGDRSAAFNSTSKPQSVEEAREGLRDSIARARSGSPPLSITTQQEEQIMSQFDRIMEAAGTPGIEDDRSAALGMSSQLAGIRRT